MKFAQCYWCMANEKSIIPYGKPYCLLGEKQEYHKSKYSFIYAIATRHNCRPKTIKEYCQRAEQWIIDNSKEVKDD